METETSTDAIGQLLDREAIRECIFRYCRGIDRQDEQALRSAASSAMAVVRFQPGLPT